MSDGSLKSLKNIQKGDKVRCIDGKVHEVIAKIKINCENG